MSIPRAYGDTSFGVVDRSKTLLFAPAFGGERAEAASASGTSLTTGEYQATGPYRQWVTFKRGFDPTN